VRFRHRCCIAWAASYEPPVGIRNNNNKRNKNTESTRKQQRGKKKSQCMCTRSQTQQEKESEFCLFQCQREEKAAFVFSSVEKQQKRRITTRRSFCGADSVAAFNVIAALRNLRGSLFLISEGGRNRATLSTVRFEEACRSNSSAYAVRHVDHPSVSDFLNHLPVCLLPFLSCGL
jgi:hypothetical protein